MQEMTPEQIQDALQKAGKPLPEELVQSLPGNKTPMGGATEPNLMDVKKHVEQTLASKIGITSRPKKEIILSNGWKILVREPKASDMLRAGKLIGSQVSENGQPSISFMNINQALVALSIDSVNGVEVRKPTTEAELYELVDAFETMELWTEFIVAVSPSDKAVDPKDAAEALKKRPQTST